MSDSSQSPSYGDSTVDHWQYDLDLSTDRTEPNRVEGTIVLPLLLEPPELHPRAASMDREPMLMIDIPVAIESEFLNAYGTVDEFESRRGGCWGCHREFSGVFGRFRMGA